MNFSQERDLLAKLVKENQAIQIPKDALYRCKNKVVLDQGNGELCPLLYQGNRNDLNFNGYLMGYSLDDPKEKIEVTSEFELRGTRYVVYVDYSKDGKVTYYLLEFVRENTENGTVVVKKSSAAPAVADR